ncbi:hypothetical protein MUY27_05580 [Mucilaginibacter sp. RS28]|uniref:Uncharacterized protein n=1 Tax=Mucilaginibacter straminoryzae TaxID=2932774 RepID=A0A9X1X105_9SPHI|nr:hypothetical protein [Mucilaginibacter straminoryzae]MCJ8209169.1 hypothetical protein [Mucilaginibacter straminoryzae]
MKYAIICGSNLFVADRPVITFIEDGQSTEVLHIHSLGNKQHAISDIRRTIINTNLTDLDGHQIMLSDQDYYHSNYRVKRDEHSVSVTNLDGDIVLEITYIGIAEMEKLPESVCARLKALSPAQIIRIKGDFMIGEHHITIDNERMFVDDESYKEAVQTDKDGIKLSCTGLLV